MLLRNDVAKKRKQKNCSPCSHYCTFIAETSGLVAIEEYLFENVKIKVLIYCQVLVAMEVFIISEHLMQRKQIELLEA